VVIVKGNRDSKTKEKKKEKRSLWV